MIGSHIIVGYAETPAGRQALALAAAIAQVTGGALTVAAVYPPESPGLAVEAQANLAHAATLLAETPAEYLTFESRGTGRGLTVLASRMRADLIVVGSAAGGQRGRVTVGSVADHLLHLSPEAVALAPEGWEPAGGLARLTLMYVRRPQADEAVERAARAAARFAVPLRLVTLDLRASRPEPLHDDLALAARHAWESSGVDAETELATGYDVPAAMAALDWLPGELLVCAASEDAQAHRVFLGEAATKVVRAAGCPVLLLPRGYA